MDDSENFQLYTLSKSLSKYIHWKLEFNLVLSIYAAKINTDHNASIQCAGLVVLKSLKLSGVSLILYQKLDKYVSSQPDFVVGNLLW